MIELKRSIRKNDRELGRASDTRTVGWERPNEAAVVPKRGKRDKLTTKNIQAIERLWRAGSSISDIEQFTGFGHGTIGKYVEGIERAERFVRNGEPTAAATPTSPTNPQPVKSDAEIARTYPPQGISPENAPYVKPPSETLSKVVEGAHKEKPDVTSSDVLNLKVNLNAETLLLFAGAAQRAGKHLNEFMQEDVLPHMQLIDLLKEACPTALTAQQLQTDVVDRLLESQTYRNMMKAARKEVEKQTR